MAKPLNLRRRKNDKISPKMFRTNYIQNGFDIQEWFKSYDAVKCGFGT